MKALRKHNIVVSKPTKEDIAQQYLLQSEIDKAKSVYEASGEIQTVHINWPLYIGDNVVKVPNGVQLLAESLHCENGGGIEFSGQVECINKVSIYCERWKGMNGMNWSKENCGISVKNCRKSTFTLTCEAFYYGLKVWGEKTESNSGGCVENKFFLQNIRDNRYNIFIPNKGRQGWANQNSFFGGKVSSRRVNNTQEGDSISIYIEGDGTSFYDVNLEGTQQDLCLHSKGTYNSFFNCRYEGVKGKIRIDGYGNTLLGGYQVPAVEQILGNKTALTIIGDGFIHSTGSLVNPSTPVVKIHRGQSTGNILEIGNNNSEGDGPIITVDHQGTLSHFGINGKDPIVKIGEPGKAAIQIKSKSQLTDFDGNLLL